MVAAGWAGAACRGGIGIVGGRCPETANGGRIGLGTLLRGPACEGASAFSATASAKGAGSDFAAADLASSGLGGFLPSAGGACADAAGVAAALSLRLDLEGAGPDASSATRSRMARARSSSRELEWVFFSAMPSSGSRSMILLGLTSSSRANSLIRILLITKRPCRHGNSPQIPL